MHQKPQFHGQKDSCAVQINSCPAESNGNCPPTPISMIYGVCPYGVFGAQLRKAEKRKVRTKNTSLTCHRLTNMVSMATAVRQKVDITSTGGRTIPLMGMDRSIATCKVAPSNTVNQ